MIGKNITNYKTVTQYSETTLDDGDEFIMVDVNKNTSFVGGNYRNKLVIVLHTVSDHYLQTSLVRYSWVIHGTSSL